MRQREELGVTPPLGFWDPLGFSKFENTEADHLVEMGGQQFIIPKKTCKQIVGL